MLSTEIDDVAIKPYSPVQYQVTSFSGMQGKAVYQLKGYLDTLWVAKNQESRNTVNDGRFYRDDSAPPSKTPPSTLIHKQNNHYHQH